jgi:hypothetical protein
VASGGGQAEHDVLGHVTERGFDISTCERLIDDLDHRDLCTDVVRATLNATYSGRH